MAETIKIWGVKDPNVSGQLVLADKLGCFKEEGLNVSYRLIQSGTMMPREILRATVKPFAWTQTVITTMILREQNLDVKIVAPLADISGTQQVIIRKDSGIQTPQDLESKKIGIAEGAAVYVALQNMAHDFGIDPSKIQIVNLLPAQQVSAFQQGDIDAMACWEPWTIRAKEAGGVFYFSGTTSNIPGYEGPVAWLIDQSMLMTTAEHIEHDQTTLCAIMRALLKATQFITENLKEAARLLTGPLELGYFESQHMLEHNRYSMRMDSTFKIGVFSLREFLYKANIISSMPDEHELYTSDLLKQIDPGLVALDTKRGQEVQVTISENIYTRKAARLVATPDKPLTFLIVDDSQVIRRILNEVIETIEGKVLGEASNGREAIAQYKTLAPDIVIMDLSMPDMTGIDAIDAILKFNPEASIIVLSGSNYPEIRQEVFALGAKMFISKPFELEKIRGAIQTLIQS